MEFHQKLRKLRKENGMSQEELAAQLGVSRQAVGKWENGQGYPETDTLLLISNLFRVSLDYLLKENALDTDSDSDTEPGYYASREVVEGYLSSKRLNARWIGAGVAILVFGIMFPMLFEGEIGTALLLISAAIGVGILVSRVFVPKRYEEMETQPLVFDPTFLREFRGKYQGERRRYGAFIVTGIVLCILSILLGLVPQYSADADRLTSLMPVIWAIAVYLFIVAGSALGASGLIVNNEEHIKELNTEKELEEAQRGKDYGWLWGSIMPLAGVAFLAIGFIWDAWHPGWLIFPLAALICVGVSGMLSSRR